MAGDIRRNKIVELIKSQGNISCVELSRVFKVTPETIRRDLTYLQEQGTLTRTHGGAIASIEFDLLSSDFRKQENFEQKLSIARKAASFICDGDVIYFDAGTTPSLICEFLPQDKNIFIITNSVECIGKLTDKPNITLISTGGILRRETMAFTGENAMHALRSATLNKAFISAIAVSEKHGVMDSHGDEASLNRLAIEKALETFLLVDSTKFGKIAYISVCPIDSISTIITDSRLDPGILASLKKMQLNVLIADEEPAARNSQII